MAVDSANRGEFMVKVDGGGDLSGSKIRRDSSYSSYGFRNDPEKTEKQKEDNERISSGSETDDDDDDDEEEEEEEEEEDFDFVQSNQGMEDPPSKLIGQFLNRQKVCGDFFLDMDLEMDELRPGNRDLPHLRRRQNSESSAKEKEDEIVRCSSIQRNQGQFQRQASNLVKAKTRSRLMDPPERCKAGAGRSGLMSTNMEEEEDPLFGEDLPEGLRKEKLSVWVLLEWVSLILMIAAFVCSLSIPYWRKKKLWKLVLWKWEVLVLVLTCGRLVSGWIVRIVVFLIERNFLLRKRVLYFVYGVRKSVQNCLWLCLVLIAWHYLFDKKVRSETNIQLLKNVTNVLVCLVAGVMLWLVKTLLVKVLASSFHMSTYFDRIQESLFTQYVIEAISGPPLIELQNIEGGRIANVGTIVPPGLKASPKNRRIIGSGLLQKSPRDKSPKLSRLLSKKGEQEDHGISIDYLHKLSTKNVSAWSMKRLMKIIRHGALSTLDERIQDCTYGKETNEIKSEFEAKIAARKIFRNVAEPGSRYIYMEDIGRFMREDEALKTMSLFEGGSESRRISKTALKNWVVNAFRERRALALTLNDTKTAVNRLHRVVNIFVSIIILVVWLVMLGLVTSKFLLFLSSQLVVLAFIFGNTLKTIFEAIIFLFVMHPFDVGDRCVIGDDEMVVEEMNILNTIFLRYDNLKVKIPNSVLAMKVIGNYYRSPDMGDAVEFCVHIATPAEKIAVMRQKILSYIEKKKDHWGPAPMLIFKDVEDLNMVRFAVWLCHRMNFQDMGERFVRRALLVEEMVKIFRELDLQYRLYPVDINVRTLPISMPNVASDRVPPGWKGAAP